MADMAWLEQLINEFREQIKGIAFYEKIDGIRQPEDLVWAKSLYHHSSEFPQVLALRYSLCSEDRLKDFMLEHVITERGHCDLLEGWMRTHAILCPGENPRHSTPTMATISGISYGYRLVLGDTVDAEIVGLNTAVETCS